MLAVGEGVADDGEGGGVCWRFVGGSGEEAAIEII